MTKRVFPARVTVARPLFGLPRAYLTGVVVLLTAAGPAGSADHAESPGLRRTIHHFDFNERKDGNFEALPMHWRKLGGEGFPSFARGAFDPIVGRTAPPSFYLGADGRNAAYWYQGPATTVPPNSEHLVIGYIRPDRLVGARAGLSAYYLDRQRLPVSGTQVFSRLVGGDPDDERWHQVEIRLPAAPPAAQTIGLTAWVVQASVWDPRTRPHRHIELPDLEGGAWFDDVTTYRMPSARLAIDAPGHIFVPPHEPTLQVTVAEVDAVGLKASLEVRSASGDIVHQTAIPVQTTERVRPQPVRLTGLQPGLYEAVLSVSVGPGTALSRRVRFARLAPLYDPGAGVARHFGVCLDPGAPVESRTTQAMLAALGVGAVKIPVWGRSVIAEASTDGGADELLHELVKARVALTGVLSAPPAELVESAGSFARSLLEILSEDPAGWRSQLAAVITPYASVFRAWQVGADGDREVTGHPALGTVLRNVRNEMVPLLTAVDLTVPGDAGALAEGQTLPAEEITLLIDRDIHDDWIPAYLAQYRALDYQWVSAYLESGSGAEYARLPFLAEFARRIISTRHAGVATTYVPQLWHSRATLSAPVTEPTEAFMVYRTIIDLLGDRTPGPRLTPAPGVEAFAFHDLDQSVLVLWDSSAPPEGRVHQLQLGSAWRQIDLWGQATPLTALDDGRREVPVYARPTFIEGVERWLLDFISGVGIEPAKVELSLAPKTHRIKLTNSGKQPRSGRLELQTPSAWEVRPRQFGFHLAPQSVFEQPVEIRYGHNEPAGPKNIQAVIHFESEPPLRLEVPLLVELGITDVDVWGFALLEGDRLVLRHGITNRSELPLSFRSFAVVPGRSRQFRVIAALPPGASTIAEYRFENADRLTGRTLRLGLREVDGPRNHSIELTAP